MRILSVRFPRRLVQLGCALAFIAIPFINTEEIHLFSGNFLAFDFAGVPLGDPLAALQVALASLSPTGRMLTGALIALLLASVLGAAFCSWLCPYGFLSELVHGKKEAGAAGMAAALEQSGSLVSGHSEKKKHGPSGRPFMSRLLIVGAGLLLTVTLVPFPALNQLSMPGWYSRILQHLALYGTLIPGGAALLAGMLAVERVSNKRLWCRYLCPQSVLLSLCGTLFPGRLQVTFSRKKCTCPASARACGKACSLKLDPRAADSFSQRLQCTNCGDCVDACRFHGQALGMRFGGRQQ